MESRKEKILDAIIASYIATPHPVGSRTISKEYDLGVSSATIRNEMSDLEDLGYLSKPHSSAGRIPSERAYRFYVDRYLASREEESLPSPSFFQEKGLGIDTLLAKTLRYLAEQTEYLAFVTSPRIRDTSLRSVELFPLDEYTMLCLLIGNQGVVEKTLLRLRKPIRAEEVAQIRLALNRELTGINFSEVESLSLHIEGPMRRFEGLITRIVEMAVAMGRKVSQREIHAEGWSNLLAASQVQDFEEVRNLLSFCEQRNNLLRLVPELDEVKTLSVVIGSEHPLEAMAHSSIITATYSGREGPLGQVGLIGPMRMDYIPMMRLLEGLSHGLSQRLGATMN